MPHQPRVRPAATLALVVAAASLAIAAPAASATTIWSATAAPTVASASDTASVEIGVKFRSDVAGTVSGVRFYKGAGNTGTHTGTLWTAAGAKLASATFSGETASGWQQANFATPVSIAANTTYVASYHAPAGHYAGDNGYFATAGHDNAPLHALRDGVDGGDGVYVYGSATAFPTNTFASSNYWVDVVFTASGPDTTPPALTSTSPAANATGVAATTTVKATFNEDVQPAVAFTLKDAAGQTVTATVAYASASRTATLTPSAALKSSTKYTATVAAKDTAGNAMTAFSWSFTTAASPGSCPCSLWPASTVPAVPSAADNSAVELGVRFRSDVSGFVTGLRFYKGAGNTGTHVGHLWTNAGTLLATATFTNETATGWQTVTLASPVAVAANTTYVASYFAPAGRYAADSGYFAAKGADAAPLHAPQDGTQGANGVYVYGAGAFPTNTFQSTNYWVDVIFNQTSTDTIAPTLTGRSPEPGSTSAPASSPVTATFSEPVQSSTISITLTGPSGAVAGSTSYSASTSTATFTAALAPVTRYTVTVAGAKDPSGNTMSPVTWSFTTAAPPPPPPTKGPGGPILLITSSANRFATYYAEVLRNEGLNEFDTVDASSFSASSLSGHDVVVVGETPLTAAQVTALTTFVNAGGSLIAMRPDTQLSGLLGLTRGSGSLSNAYLGINAANPAAAGITAATMQYHGPADRYTLNGASTVATLFSSATATTANPAVTVRAVGTSGGQAAAFTFDLARSVVLTRQGNPAWAGQERDGTAPIRSDDLFFGGTQPDWVDLAKVAIPQADEQQRLFANLIETMDRHRMPLPRFWYFPNALKAVVVGTGDDHATGGTAGRFAQYAANSPAGCSVANWTCLRFTSYVYPSTPLTNSVAAGYDGQGFEVGLHLFTGCADFTPASLESDLSTQLQQWSQKYTSLPSPVTSRTHCIAFSDWLTEPTTEAAHGIRLDTNYYYWPGSWIQNRPGFFTGSGLPMRFANTDGTMLDVYQATTQMTDESDQSYPFTPDTLLDRALGPQGYYGAFTANMHTDNAQTPQDDALIASAGAHHVPIVAARQMLKWLDGRNGSSFKGLNWSAGTLSFSVATGAGAQGLTVLLPTASAAGQLTSLTLAGAPVSYRTETIKGLEYAIFAAGVGTYAAHYAAPAGAVAVSSLRPTTTATGGAQLTWRTDRATSATVHWGTTPARLDRMQVDAISDRVHRIVLRGAQPGSDVFYRLTVRDLEGRRTTRSGRLAVATRGLRPAVNRRARVEALPDGSALVRWRTDAAAAGSVSYGTSPGRLTEIRYASRRGVRHLTLLAGLAPGRRYYYRLAARDALGRRARSPMASFRTPAYGVADSRLAQWRTGSTRGTAVGARDDGELRLARGRRSGTFVSRRLDARQMVAWRVAGWYASVPLGARLEVSVHSGSTSTRRFGWTRWIRLGARGGRLPQALRPSRYLQYRVRMSASGRRGPVLRSVWFTSTGRPPARVSETAG